MIGETMNTQPVPRHHRDSQGLGTARHPSIVLGHLGLVTENLEARLRQLGYRVTLASDGHSARLAAGKGKTHAVILPVDAKSESGFLTCVKLLAGSPHTRVYLYGAKSDANVRDAFLAGATGYIDDTTNVTKIVELLTK